ncbi:LysR substrate-binding domain-containing protein [Neorhizobium galegae]|uniref:LysR family transcriptional regulator n=1 Tax=Neorhizobium galegae TaxID=399 RepID=UPI0021022A75|nr:LysR family transcriptional regulator [Neorhizobium galegae]MCQ1769067.1 LysR substrate-binding domain-containing protein [Neorhizobium galegae]MCQ1846232.1 LysR substrate-binding domain-containing protein [Neorhizobium galegae]
MDQATLKELEAAIAIARRGTFRAASIDLGLSTTALSHTIGRLEAALGVRLFNRTTRSVSLTDAGRLFMQQVAPSLQDLHAALGSVREQRETPSGTIRINAAPFAARSIIKPLVLEFLRRYPDMNVDIVTEGKMVDIVRDGFDLGVRVEGLVPSDMIAVSLGRPQRHAVVGSPEYVEKHGIPIVPPDLLAHSCIRVRLPDGSLFRWRFEKGGEQVQMDVRGQITLDEASLTRTAVLDGAGLGYLFEQDILPEIEVGQVIRVLADWTPSYPGLCLYYPGRRNLSAGVRAFLELARELSRTGDQRPKS